MLLDKKNCELKKVHEENVENKGSPEEVLVTSRNYEGDGYSYFKVDIRILWIQIQNTDTEQILTLAWLCNFSWKTD